MKQSLCGIALLAMIISSAKAVTVVPMGLNPGDNYRLAFVTSTTRNATSNNIADYNAFVTGVANTVPELIALGTTWTAIGSTFTVDARDNTGTNPTSSPGVPIYLLNDTKLADNNADLWNGDIDNPLEISEAGTALNVLVWTGTGPTGFASLGSWLGNNIARTGVSGLSNAIWINAGVPSTASLMGMYAVSAVVTVVPVQGASWLFGSALALLGAARKRNRQAATT